MDTIKSSPVLKLENCMRFRFESERERLAAGYGAELMRTASGTDSFMFSPQLFLYIVSPMQTM